MELLISSLDLEQEYSPKEPSLSSKLRELKKEFPLSKGFTYKLLNNFIFKVIAEPLTYRERDIQEKRPVSRKTKSLEKPLNLFGIERDYKLSRFEPQAPSEELKPHSSSRRSIEVLEDENKV